MDRSTVSRWTNRFHGGCVNMDNDPRPGRPRTSTNERSVKLVADTFEDHYAIGYVKNFLEPREFQPLVI